MSILKKYLFTRQFALLAFLLAIAVAFPDNAAIAALGGVPFAIGYTEAQFAALRHQSYKSTVEMLAQQVTSVTDGTHRVEPMDGKRTFFPQVGSVKMQRKTGRAALVPQVDTPFRDRACTAIDEYMRDFVDSFDKLRTATDPGSAIGMAQVAAARRSKDKILVDAVLGTAYTGEDGATTVAFPSAQKIAAGSAGFTLAKLRQAVQKLRTKSADQAGDQLHVFWTAKQEYGFVDTAEVKSSDYNNQKVMVDGKLAYFYGTHFHRLEDFEDDDGTVVERMLPLSSTTRSCPMWTNSGVCAGFWKPLETSVDWLPERRAFQVYAGHSFGATRMQEKKVIQIDVVET